VAYRSEAELEQERLQILAAQQDKAAFAPLYERYVDQIFAYVFTLTKDRELAEDVTAATFARAIEELPRFEWRGVPYSAWLYRVASNLVARHKRRGDLMELSLHVPADGLAPDEIVEKNTHEAEIRAMVATRPADQRQAIVLRFAGDLRNKEIADIMGRSEGAIKLLTFRALTNLRRRLGAPLPAEREPLRES
jgi:RNA polymerase sigma-70 factor (ECF subfamily)